MPEILLGIIGILVLIASMVVLVFFLRKQITQEMRLAQEQILQTARGQMELAQNDATSQLEMRKQAIEHTVAGLKDELGKYQQMLRESQQNSANKFGNLENELKNASIATQKLRKPQSN